MTVSTERVAEDFFNPQTGVAIPVAFPAYESADIKVYYGRATLKAAYGIDYEVKLDPPQFDTFTVTPKAGLIAKIAALIEADPTEQNRIVVRREMEFETDATPAGVRNVNFTSREFDRTALRDQELRDGVRRAVKLSKSFVGDTEAPTIDEFEPGHMLAVDNSGSKVITPVSIVDFKTVAELAPKVEEYVSQIKDAALLVRRTVTTVDGQSVYTHADDGSRLHLFDDGFVVNSERDLTPGVDYRATPEGGLELLVPFDGDTILSVTSVPRTSNEEANVLAIEAMARAEAAAADAVNNAPWNVKDAPEFLALSGAVVGARYRAPGMAWDVVAKGTAGSIDHPVSEVGYFVVNVAGSDIRAWAQPTSANFGAEFQRAIENSASGELYLPGGEYTAEALHLNRSISIRGTNRKRTKLVLTGGITHDGHKASIVASGSDAEGLSSQMDLSDMEIQITAPDTSGLLVMRKTNMTDVHIRGAANDGILFFSGNPNTKAPYFCQFNRVWSKQNGKNGLRLSENCNANAFDLCQFDSNGEHGVRLERFGTPAVNQVLYNTIFTGGQASYNQMDGLSLFHSVNTQVYGTYTEYNSQIDGGNPKTGAYKNMQLGPTASRNLIHMGEVGTDIDPALTLGLNTVLSNTVTIGGRLYSPILELTLGYPNVGPGQKVTFNGVGGCSHSIEFRESGGAQARMFYDGSPAAPNNIFALQTTNDNGVNWNTLISGLSNGRLGFYGATPVARQSIAPAATDEATAIALANSIRTILINLGLAQ